MDQTFAAKLKALRKSLGLTQVQVSKLLECSSPRISEWENARRVPRPITQKAIILRLLEEKR